MPPKSIPPVALLLIDDFSLASQDSVPYLAQLLQTYPAGLLTATGDAAEVFTTIGCGRQLQSGAAKAIEAQKAGSLPQNRVLEKFLGKLRETSGVVHIVVTPSDNDAIVSVLQTFVQAQG